MRARLRAGAALLLLAIPGGEGLRAAPDLGDGVRSEILCEVETPYQYVVVRRDVHPDGTVRRVLTINEGVRACHSYRIEGRVLTEGRYWDDHVLSLREQVALMQEPPLQWLDY